MSSMKASTSSVLREHQYADQIENEQRSSENSPVSVGCDNPNEQSLVGTISTEKIPAPPGKPKLRATNTRSQKVLQRPTSKKRVAKKRPAKPKSVVPVKLAKRTNQRQVVELNSVHVSTDTKEQFTERYLDLLVNDRITHRQDIEEVHRIDAIISRERKVTSLNYIIAASESTNRSVQDNIKIISANSSELAETQQKLIELTAKNNSELISAQMQLIDKFNISS